MRRPDQWRTLFAAFQQARDNGAAYEFISSGLLTCIENAKSLLEDFRVLASTGRSAAAQLMYATAMEEMGKALLLLDFCRIPWEDNKRVWLELLCKAFYDHGKKAGYARTLFFLGSGHIGDALQLYKMELIEYRPNLDPEGSEPDEYAAWLTDREWALYVDWNEFDGHWSFPPSSSLAQYYSNEKWAGEQLVGEYKIRELLDPLRKAAEEGVFGPSALAMIHSEMAKHYVGPTTTNGEVAALVQRAGEKLRASGVSVSDETLASNVFQYPLYAVIVNPQQIKLAWER